MISSVAWAVAALLGVWFVVAFIREPRRLQTGVLPLVILGSSIVALFFSPHSGARFTGVMLALVLVFIMLLSYVLLIPFLLFNGIIVLRREGRSLALFVPVALALVLMVAPVFTNWALMQGTVEGRTAWAFVGFAVAGAGAYLGFVFLSFVLFGVLYSSRVHSVDADAVLILGSRVFDGRVPPLLASRLDAAIAIYERARETGQPPPTLICCGGQGDDEIAPEAEAMAAYLREHGVPPEHVVEERASRTTKENLRFGNDIALSQFERPKLAITTNDYHSFRTALLAGHMGIPAKVVGSHTAAYYRPAAFLREFIAILRDNLWVHAAILATFMLYTITLMYRALT